MRSASAAAERRSAFRTLDAPDFIGIGAPRCGTTWVYRMFRLHPEIWIPWKEIHFFDSSDPATHSGFHIQSRGFRFRQSWRSLLSRMVVGAVPGGAALARRALPRRSVHIPGYRWTFRYLCREATTEWYEALSRIQLK